ncbi:MAG: hypothetical protein L0241_06170, partial [Planctomycetia bacterium]|nr:hypothetical protein [Planctomycetia bacterium]
RSILRELKSVLHATRTGIPEWMSEAKEEVSALSARFSEQASAMLARLDDLTKRVEAALRRAETNSPVVGESVARVVPWAIEALEYLDKRSSTGASSDCTFPELFHAVCVKFPELTIPDFQAGVRRLHDVRAMRLLPSEAITEPEFAVVVNGKLMFAVGR